MVALHTEPTDWLLRGTAGGMGHRKLLDPASSQLAATSIESDLTLSTITSDQKGNVQELGGKVGHGTSFQIYTRRHTWDAEHLVGSQ